MKKTLAIILAFLICLPLGTFAAAAGKNETITHTLDLASLYMNGSGPGYDWQNMNDLLILDNLRIETEDDVGIKIPEVAVIELHGDNYIKAKKIAMTCVNAMTIKGSGTLTLIAEDTGIVSYSLSTGDVVRFRDGNVHITAGKYGVFSEFAEITFNGANVTINTDEYAVKGETVKFTGGKSVLDGNVYADEKLTVSGCDLTVNAKSGAALGAKNGISIDGVKISAGSSESALAEVESYGGETSVRFQSTVDRTPKSALFGENVPKYVDYIVFFIIIIAAAAIIAVPIIIKKKKTEKLIKANEEAKKAAKAAKK